jgi:hypothetical protein
MTTLTPAREAVARAMVQVTIKCEESVANGTPRHSAECSKALIEAAMMQFADMADQRIEFSSAMASFEMGFANAIMSVVSTMAKKNQLRPEILVLDFTLALMTRILEHGEQGPTVTERVKDPRDGHA